MTSQSRWGGKMGWRFGSRRFDSRDYSERRRVRSMFHDKSKIGGNLDRGAGESERLGALHSCAACRTRASSPTHMETGVLPQAASKCEPASEQDSGDGEA